MDTARRVPLSLPAAQTTDAGAPPSSAVAVQVGGRARQPRALRAALNCWTHPPGRRRHRPDGASRCAAPGACCQAQRTGEEGTPAAASPGSRRRRRGASGGLAQPTHGGLRRGTLVVDS
eukprot:scaffold1127_cov361-Prasinococcus_capsulatus_cf.AAC.11